MALLMADFADDLGRGRAGGHVGKIRAGQLRDGLADRALHEQRRDHLLARFELDRIASVEEHAAALLQGVELRSMEEQPGLEQRRVPIDRRVRRDQAVEGQPLLLEAVLDEALPVGSLIPPGRSASGQPQDRGDGHDPPLPGGPEAAQHHIADDRRHQAQAQHDLGARRTVEAIAEARDRRLGPPAEESGGDEHRQDRRPRREPDEAWRDRRARAQKQPGQRRPRDAQPPRRQVGPDRDRGQHEGGRAPASHEPASPEIQQQRRQQQQGQQVGEPEHAPELQLGQQHVVQQIRAETPQDRERQRASKQCLDQARHGAACQAFRRQAQDAEVEERRRPVQQAAVGHEHQRIRELDAREPCRVVAPPERVERRQAEGARQRRERDRQHAPAPPAILQAQVDPGGPERRQRDERMDGDRQEHRRQGRRHATTQQPGQAEHEHGLRHDPRGEERFGEAYGALAAIGVRQGNQGEHRAPAEEAGRQFGGEQPAGGDEGRLAREQDAVLRGGHAQVLDQRRHHHRENRIVVLGPVGQEQVLSDALGHQVGQRLAKIQDAVVPHAAIRASDHPQRRDQEGPRQGRNAQRRELLPAVRGLALRTGRLGRGGFSDGRHVKSPRSGV